MPAVTCDHVQSVETPSRDLLADPDRLIGVSAVSALGYGHPQTIRQRIRSGALPAVMVGGVWKVRVGDLPRPRALTQAS